MQSQGNASESGKKAVATPPSYDAASSDQADERAVIELLTQEPLPAGFLGLKLMREKGIILKAEERDALLAKMMEDKVIHKDDEGKHHLVGGGGS